MKKCSKCKIEKELNEFHNHPSIGKQSQCKKCQLEWLSEYWKSPRGVAYRKKYYQENKELFAKAGRRWRKLNPKKANQFVYNWYKGNVKQFVATQDKYQSKVPPSVYCIKYDDTVIYVGKARRPLARVNVHLSTIKTDNNITKVNKLHSYCGYDKSRFSYEFLEEGEYDSLLEIERYYEELYDAKGNYKRLFPNVKSLKQIFNEIGGTPPYIKYPKKK